MDSNEPSSENEKLNKEDENETRDTSEPWDELDEGQTWEDIKLVRDQKDSSGIPPDPPLRKNRWLKRLILLFCLLALSAIGLTQAPSASIVCQGCHEMKPEIATWQASSHSKVACIQCHTEINAAHFFQLIHFTKKYYLPIQVKKSIPESVCINCHSDNRTITPRGDLIVPHQNHEKEGISCTECHSGVAHGGIAERLETIDGDFSRWTDVTGRQNMSGQYKTLSMTECLNCHKERQGPQNCEACHSRIVTPPSHKTEDWVANGLHGQEAFKDIDACNKCHSSSLNLVRVAKENKVVSYAQSNAFCVDCHSKKPPSNHTPKSFLHGDQASKNQTGCLVCHDKSTAKKANAITKTVCMSCHAEKHSQPEFHPVPIQSNTGPDASCYTCHVENNCIKCHK